jgi:soluble lytic murein transglycosylase
MRRKSPRAQRNAAAGKHRHAKHADVKKKSKARQKEEGSPRKEAPPPLTGRSGAGEWKRIDLARKAKTDEATATRNRITDPAAQKLVEWFILRHPETTAGFSRYAAFIAANPEWPSAAQLRKRAEARLWQERSDAARVRGFMGETPASARGKLALARIKLAEGDRDAAGQLARDAWRTDELSGRVGKRGHSKRSATFSPATTTVRAWTSASASRTSRAPGAPRNSSATTSLRS